MSKSVTAIVAILMLNLAACTTTQVHVFTDGMSATELSTIREQLSQRRYDVLFNSLPVPEAITIPTVIYSPLHKQLAQVEKLRDTLFELGHPVELTPVSKGNHFYSSENVGVYLNTRASTGERRMMPVGKEFPGDCPEVDAYLTLRHDLDFHLEFIRWDETKNKEISTTQSGKWWQAEETLFLEFDTYRVEFKIEHFKEQKRRASFTGLKLHNSGSELQRCHFVYRELDLNNLARQ